MIKVDPLVSGHREGIAVKGARGFTLAELLVVMAIVAILAGILFPVVRQAQDAARMRVCSSNLKQLGNAFLMYFDDYDGFTIPTRAKYNNAFCPDPLLKYCKDTKINSTKGNPKRIWICPGDRSYGRKSAQWAITGVPLSSYYYPYGAYLASSESTDVLWGMTRLYTPRRPEQWARPSRDMLLCDQSPDFHNGRADNTNSGNMAKCVNFLMLDMHIVIGTRSDRYQQMPYYVLVYDNPYSYGYNPGK